MPISCLTYDLFKDQGTDFQKDIGVVFFNHKPLVVILLRLLLLHLRQLLLPSLTQQHIHWISILDQCLMKAHFWSQRRLFDEFVAEEST